MSFYFSLDSSAQIESVRLQMAAENRARRARLLAEQERQRKAALERALALVELDRLVRSRKTRTPDE